ncbi:MAG: hypothetical protein IPG22_04600 [Acidobacteria bacterium]|nr:hypothetical protein [Acidobacteriota bacterium]
MKKIVNCDLSSVLRLVAVSILFAAAAAAQTVPAPKDVLGFEPGDDKKLASWAQTVDYFKKLDAASDRVIFQEIGKTTMGAPFVFATISSPENLRNLEKYKKINAQLADPRTFKSRDKFAERLIEDGKTIVLITCGIHSTEVGSHTSSFLIAHRLASSNEPEILNILKNTIILLVPSLNPDGVDIVKNWYDKTLGTPYEGTTPPELYHKYVGHDNNRDWYAFTQVETQLTVDKIHNVWHPQIVHDIHQQGANGSRLFLPPYMDPVEPNVPKKIVEGYTVLGNYIAGDLRKKGFEGITTNSTYDAWTPARAYSHYHGGVRILSETASARLASPITIQENQVRGGLGYDARKESPNFGPVWKGGEWKMRNITEYMTGGAFSLLNHAADNREKWLSRFYEVGKEAVKPRKDGELFAYVFPKLGNDDVKNQGVRYDLSHDRRQESLLGILERGGVTVDRPDNLAIAGKKYPRGTAVVRLDQPYGAFAKALLERQKYPDLLDASGNPISPYDVTAHTLSLLMNVESEAISRPFTYQLPKRSSGTGSGASCGQGHAPRYTIYRSGPPSMDEGWTRWIFRKPGGYDINCGAPVESITTSEIRQGSGSNFGGKETNTIVFPDQSAAQILNGYTKGSMPDEYVGGVGKEGVAKLKKFVEEGGTLVFLNSASDFAIEQFGLPVRDVTKGLPRKDFFIPGSILRTEINTNSPIAKGMPKESIAWFEDSPAFDIAQDARVEVIARYPTDPKNVLLSGWALGAEKIAGKAALVSIPMGKGKIVLFGFRPQYRAQSLATYPLLFNAISN